jgi:hypothetical protein
MPPVCLPAEGVYGKSGEALIVARLQENGTVLLIVDPNQRVACSPGGNGRFDPFSDIQAKPSNGRGWPKPERPVWGVQRKQADVRSWGLPTAAIDPKRR